MQGMRSVVRHSVRLRLILQACARLALLASETVGLARRARQSVVAFAAISVP